MRAARAAQRRHLGDDALLVHIKAIHAETRGGYGWPWTCKELLARGLRLLGDRVLQGLAWKIADQLRWPDTFMAEYIALTDGKHPAPVTSPGGTTMTSTRPGGRKP